jgi:cytochrome P450
VNDRLRELGPVTRIELTGGVTAWSVTGHAALRELLVDPRIAKRAQHWTALAAGQVPANWPLMPFIMNVSMATSDGGDHRRLRA